ncbi:MAG TPA: TadE/TadG family type IV pilus assembly protein [Candidatus Cybelea sp.]|jgi:Flp pilus assembly protein TadG
MKKSLKDSESGTSAIEFAILAPVFVLLVLGLIDFGRYMYYSIVAAHAARAGVQYGAQNVYSAADTAGMQNAASADAPGGFLPVATHYCSLNGSAAMCGTGTPAAGNTYYVKVVVTGVFNPIISYPGIPHSMTISSTAQMRVAAQ